ncbi:MAG TPA: hypothetical protein VGY13_07920 [Solirubrobacteraceae bacterium]|jgi:hypothetical protein|nr:hypothetical protein [Solirubrobacteraceae bacterium]
MRKGFELAGVIAAAILIAFGIASIAIGVSGKDTVNKSLAEQKVVGTPDMTPAGIKAEASKAGLDVSKLSIPTCSVANKAVTSGSNARCFAQYMTIHALEATGGKYYSQMPRYATANGEGTNVEADALKGKTGQPVDNPAREVWIQETALSTGLNTSYMASQISLFGIVVGIALLLAGLGFGVLSLGGALRGRDSAVADFRPGRHTSPVSPTSA